MTAYITQTGSLALVPENSDEKKTLEDWSMRRAKIENTQRTLEGVITSLIVKFGNE